MEYTGGEALLCKEKEGENVRKVEFWGDYACFSRPGLKVERMSYDDDDPSAARGMLEAIYWHPGLRWVIDHIYVCEAIRFTGIRRNEVKDKIVAGTVKQAMEERGRPVPLHQGFHPAAGGHGALSCALCGGAHFEMTDQAAPGDNPGKISGYYAPPAGKGPVLSHALLRDREFPANFRPWDGGTVETAYPGDRRDLGLMLYDMDYSDPEHIAPMFSGRCWKTVC